MNRKSRRALEKYAKSAEANPMAEKMLQFSRLPEQCSACDSAFDKKDREMVQTWKVLVRQEVVRLFCPECIELTKEAIGNVRENTENIERSTE